MLKHNHDRLRFGARPSILPAILVSAPLVAVFLLFALPSYAWPQAGSSTVSVTTVVTVMGPKNTTPPPVAKGDVNVTSGKTRFNVTGWDAVQRATAIQSFSWRS